MGVYVNYDDVAAATDMNVLERLTDELSPGTSQKDHVDKRIAVREATFEGFAVLQHPDLTPLRANPPEQAKLWIVSMVRYDLYGRRSMPDYVKADYDTTLLQLDNFSRTGIPALIVTPPVISTGQEIKTNMTSEDLEVMPWQSENITSVWNKMPS